jgi:membrane protease YdiL (CAAX protease family)
MGEPRKKLAAFGRAAITAFAIALIPQGVWSALLVANVKLNPRVPWAVVVIVALLVLMWRYLGGAFPPARTAQTRRRHMRAVLVPRTVAAWSFIAGGLALIALTGLWMVLAQLVRMPGSVLPSMGNVPAGVVALALVTGAAISPICEQIGIWGYAQVMLGRDFTRRDAIVLSALIFAVLPHPPFGVPLLLKIAFFFLVGLVFSVTAELTGTIATNIVVHALGLFIFFAVIWPSDPQRPLVSITGVDFWFVLHAAQAAVGAMLAVWAFIRLNRIVTPYAGAGGCVTARPLRQKA